MGKPIKSNNRNYNKKNKSNPFNFLIDAIKQKYPTAIDISICKPNGINHGFIYRTEIGGEIKQCSFITKNK